MRGDRSAGDGHRHDRAPAEIRPIHVGAVDGDRPGRSALPGTRRVDHLDQNLGAAQVELTPAEIQEIDAELSRIKVRGGRMSAQYMVEVEE
jgi:hypothetical protein